MKNIFAFFIIAVLATSCHQEYDIPTPQKERDILPAPTRLVVGQLINEDLMFLGPRLENPYTVTTMQEARRQLMDENPNLSIPEITTSHIYVRFAPANDEELYSLLQDTTIHFFDFPLDREVISGGYYHDPAIADSLPTYQYASIPIETWIRDYADSNISYEVLESLFIPEDDEDFFSGGGNDDGGSGRPGEIFIPTDPENPFIPFIPGDGEIDPNTIIPSSEDIIDMLVNRAMYLTGNLDSDGDASVQSVASTNSSSSAWTPSGTITAWDDIVEGQIPLEGVKVLARRWFTTHTGITDANGNFTCDGTFKKPANYCIKWERAYWDIREGYMGQAYYNEPSKISGEWNLSITSATPKSLAYSAIHRALYRIYYGNVDGLHRPNYAKVKIQYRHRFNDGIYGTFPNSDTNRPKIQIWGINENADPRTPSLIFSALCHELAGHGVHKQHCDNYSSLPLSYIEAWSVFAQFYLTFLEYEELNALSNLEVYSIYNPEPVLDNQYNFQLWSEHDSPMYERYNYPPIFVDIYDDFNQSNDITYDYAAFLPNDNVKYTNVPSLQNIIFSSSSFTEVKNRLLSTYNPGSLHQSFNEQSLTTLFNSYDYNPETY